MTVRLYETFHSQAATFRHSILSHFTGCYVRMLYVSHDRAVSLYITLKECLVVYWCLTL